MTRPLLFFPDKPEWDIQTQRVAAEALYGGADAFECFEAVRQIREDGLTTDAWQRRWSSLASDLVADSGSDNGAEPSATTVAQRAARASTYFRTSEFFVPFDSSDRLTLFDAARTSFRTAIPGFPVPVEIIAVPDGDVEYDGYVFHGRGASPANPGPGVVLLGGADSYAEELYFFGGCALAERGITVVVADTPGRGSTIRHKGIISRPDYEIPASRVLDALEQLESVDERRIGVVGLSLGGYYAPRLAAHDARVRALVCWCACFDVLRDIYEFCPPIRAQLTWIVGASSDEEARARLAKFSLADVAGQITCPTLISHGEADTIMDVRGAKQLYDAVGSKDKQLRIWPASAPGGDHCNYDAWPECLPFMFDWLASELRQAAA